MSESNRPEPPEAADISSGNVLGEVPAVREALADLLPTVALPGHLRDRLMQSVARPQLRYAPFYGQLSQLFDLPDAALQRVFERAAEPKHWVSLPLEGTELFHFEGGPNAASADNGLVRVRSGVTFPRHRHLGRERVLVLAGAYREENSGQVYRAADWHEMPEGSEHAYTVLPGPDLLLAVSVTGGIDVAGYGPLGASPT